MSGVPGVCRYCGCTEANACMLCTGDPCSWYDKDRTACNAPGCIRQYEADRRAAAAERRAAIPKSLYAGWGFGAVIEDMRRKARRRRRRGRAA